MDWDWLTPERIRAAVAGGCIGYVVCTLRKPEEWPTTFSVVAALAVLWVVTFT